MKEGDEAMLRLVKEVDHVLETTTGEIPDQETAFSTGKTDAIIRLRQFISQAVGQLFLGFDGKTWSFRGPGLSGKARALLESQMPFYLEHLDRHFNADQILTCIFRYPRIWKNFWDHKERLHLKLF